MERLIDHALCPIIDAQNLETVEVHMNQHGWDVPQLLQVLPQPVVQAMHSIYINPIFEQVDCIIWRYSSIGELTVASVLRRQSSPSTKWQGNFIWALRVPP